MFVKVPEKSVDCSLVRIKTIHEFTRNSTNSRLSIKQKTGDTGTRGRGDTETRGHGDAETRRCGDATRGRGNGEAVRHGDTVTEIKRGRHLVQYGSGSDRIQRAKA